MSIRNAAVRGLETLRERIVTDSVELTLRKAGVHDTIYGIYNRLLTKLVLRNGYYTLKVGSATATFPVRDSKEFKRLRSMTERDILARLLSDLRADDVFYDIGANVGVYSCLIGDVLPIEHVVAFEPHPINAKQLRDNLERNGVRAEVVQKALSDRVGEATLSMDVSSQGVSPGHNLLELTSEVEEYGGLGTGRKVVDTVRGDEMITHGKLPEPSVVKIDVEGAEFNVLKGLEDVLLGGKCRIIYCEVHRDHLSKFGASEAELHEFVEECGFSAGVISDSGSKYHLRAERKRA